METILLFNNCTGIWQEMRKYFAVENFRLQIAETEEKLYEYIMYGQGGLLIMDVEFMRSSRQIQPLHTGLDILQKIREKSNIPIMILSRNGNEEIKINALNAGADDYLIYPCSPLELLARAKSQIRRYTQLICVKEEAAGIYQMGELVIDDVCRKVVVEGKEVRLTPSEYKILRLLVRGKGKVFSVEQIYEAVWNMKAIGADNTIAVHIRHIREKIESNPKDPRYLKVVWGSGYRVG